LGLTRRDARLAAVLLADEVPPQDEGSAPCGEDMEWDAADVYDVCHDWDTGRGSGS